MRCLKFKLGTALTSYYERAYMIYLLTIVVTVYTSRNIALTALTNTAVLFCRSPTTCSKNRQTITARTWRRSTSNGPGNTGYPATRPGGNTASYRQSRLGVRCWRTSVMPRWRRTTTSTRLPRTWTCGRRACRNGPSTTASWDRRSGAS